MSKKIVKCLPVILTIVCLGLFSSFALADATTPTPGGIGDMAEGVTSAFKQIGSLMTAIAYICGFGFTIGAIFKFKAHKDNPTQVPIGTPMALLAIGISLIFLPGFITPAGKTLLGNTATDVNATAGGFTGTGVTKLPGAGTGT